MNALVSRPVHILTELSPTIGTFVRLLFRVLPCVNDQIDLFTKGFLAPFTLVVLLLFVHVKHVAIPYPLLGELLFAH